MALADRKLVVTPLYHLYPVYHLYHGNSHTVYDVLDYLAGGMTEEEILNDFPDLTGDDIRATLAFAAARERRLANSVA